MRGLNARPNIQILSQSRGRPETGRPRKEVRDSDNLEVSEWGILCP